MSDASQLGQTMRALRDERGLTLSELARQAGISKAYLSQIETGQVESPSAKTLFNIASSLGTTVAALLGEALPANATEVRICESLREFAEDAQLEDHEVNMLAQIRYRGRQPQSVEDWRFLYESIKRSIGGGTRG